MRRPAALLALALLGAAPAPIVQPAPGGDPWTADQIAILRTDVDALLLNAPALRGAHYGVYAIDTSTGAVLYAHAADDEFQPASTFKLVVGSAALDKLGAGFRWKTTLEASEDGRDVVFRASGDPLLSGADIVAAAENVQTPGPRDIFVDDSAFDLAPYPAGWTWDDFAQDYAPKISAATLNENVVGLRVSPGAGAGDPAVVRYEDGRRIEIPVDGCNATDSWSTTVVTIASTGAAGSDDTIDVRRGDRGCPEVIGSIPLGAATETVGAAVYSPIVALHEALRRAIAARGFAVALLSVGSGSVEQSMRPRSPATGRVLWTHESQTLGELIGPRFWIPSDNLFGELLLKELGLVTGGKPGSTEKGIAYERAWLKTLGVDVTTLTTADACGMSQYDRITPRDLVTILQHDWNGPNRQLVLDSLPVGGSRGTIEGIAGTAAAGRVFAKTGSMMHVRGLAGYLAPLKHGPVTFAFSVDDWNGDYPSLAALRARVLARIVGDGGVSPAPAASPS